MEATAEKLEDELKALKAKVREAKEAPVRMQLVAPASSASPNRELTAQREN